MTSTKVIYFIAAVVPFGCVALALLAVCHALRQRRNLVQVPATDRTTRNHSNFDAGSCGRNPLFQQGRCLVVR
jgi:hypothetical protein